MVHWLDHRSGWAAGPIPAPPRTRPEHIVTNRTFGPEKNPDGLILESITTCFKNSLVGAPFGEWDFYSISDFLQLKPAQF
jgi:hypothetical protein